LHVKGLRQLLLRYKPLAAVVRDGRHKLCPVLLVALFEEIKKACTNALDVCGRRNLDMVVVNRSFGELDREEIGTQCDRIAKGTKARPVRAFRVEGEFLEGRD
jgi:hypothetical protein